MASYGRPPFCPPCPTIDACLGYQKLLARNPARKQDPIDVVKLVLCDPCWEPAEFDRDFLALFVAPFHQHLLRAFYPPSHARHRQTALPHPVCLLALPHNLRIDPKLKGHSCCVWVAGIGAFNSETEHARPPADLRGCNANAAIVLHSLTQHFQLLGKLRCSYLLLRDFALPLHQPLVSKITQRRKRVPLRPCLSVFARVVWLRSTARRFCAQLPSKDRISTSLPCRNSTQRYAG
mmetsp:Transcript_58565/g.137901  ORF Transcript_58565/g.137901 Transcript_58565/m.137901 type:complete len:235 (-) Transcript_58565:341-1045(-)